MDNRKKYWIEIFIKKCTSLDNLQDQLDFYFKLYSQTYNISDRYFDELKKKYTVDEYINRLIPAIDKYFSIKDLKNIIKFYASPSGKKLINYQFLRELGEIGKKMNIEIEQAFALGNNKK